LVGLPFDPLPRAVVKPPYLKKVTRYACGIANTTAVAAGRGCGWRLGTVGVCLVWWCCSARWISFLQLPASTVVGCVKRFASARRQTKLAQRDCNAEGEPLQRRNTASTPPALASGHECAMAVFVQAHTHRRTKGKKAVNNTRVPLSVTDLVAGKTMEPNPLYTGYGWTDVSGY
jgi:hypothetical protein